MNEISQCLKFTQVHQFQLFGFVPLKNLDIYLNHIDFAASCPKQKNLTFYLPSTAVDTFGEICSLVIQFCSSPDSYLAVSLSCNWSKTAPANSKILFLVPSDLIEIQTYSKLSKLMLMKSLNVLFINIITTTKKSHQKQQKAFFSTH